MSENSVVCCLWLFLHQKVYCSYAAQLFGQFYVSSPGRAVLRCEAAQLVPAVPVASSAQRRWRSSCEALWDGNHNL